MTIDARLPSLLPALVLALAASPAARANGPIAQALANEAYVGDSQGVVVRSDALLCWRTGAWEPAKALPECDPQYARMSAVVAPLGLAIPDQGGPAPERKMPRTQEEHITLHGGALFASDSASLSDDGRKALDELIDRINRMQSLELVEITGHTDAQGGIDYNQRLSLRRAEAVRDYLVSQGVDPSLIATEGAGESDPVADNGTAEGRALNRRVEIVLRGYQRVAR